MSENSDLLGRPVSSSWLRSPIHSGPLPGSNCPTQWLLPLSPLPHPFSPLCSIHNDDINNLGLLCLGHLYLFVILKWVLLISGIFYVDMKVYSEYIYYVKGKRVLYSKNIYYWNEIALYGENIYYVERKHAKYILNILIIIIDVSVASLHILNMDS
jgi:hypothetical protein